jgi:hypothetical protein
MTRHLTPHLTPLGPTPGAFSARPRPRGWPAWLPVPRPDAPAQAAGPLDDTAAGGWFDSSLDLRRGLEVRELGPADGLAAWAGANG